MAMLKRKYIKPTKINIVQAVQFETRKVPQVTELNVRTRLNFKMHTSKELIVSPKRKRLEEALDEAVRDIAKDIVDRFRTNVRLNIQSAGASSHTKFPPLARGRHPERADYQDAYINSVRYMGGPKGKARVVASGITFDLVEYGFAVTKPPLSDSALLKLKQWIQLKDILYQFLPEHVRDVYELHPNKYVKVRDDILLDDQDSYDAVFNRRRRRSRPKYRERPSRVYSTALDKAARRVAMIIYNKSPYPPRYIFRLTWLSYRVDKRRRVDIVLEKMRKYRVLGMAKNR